jgi:hypothetical protein
MRKLGQWALALFVVTAFLWVAVVAATQKEKDKKWHRSRCTTQAPVAGPHGTCRALKGPLMGDMMEGVQMAE